MKNVPALVLELVDRFRSNKDTYLSDYNETRLRREFIDTLFETVFGWDIQNKSNTSPEYQDVIHEDSIKVAGSTKAPDYCFRVGKERKFFLETKKPSVNIKEDVGPAYQLRRYGWSAHLPLSLLTNFKEFAIYDCRIKPKQNDKADVARIAYFTYEELPQKWAEFAAVFSREAVWKGDFDRYAETTKKKHGTSEVDDEFLEEIEHWRNILARNIALRNPSLSVEELNYAVQKLIDRILFLRMCEDRGSEEYGQLNNVIAKEGTYAHLFALFELADDRYNSGLFHFNAERGRKSPPDMLTPKLIIDDKTLKDIIKDMYYPDSPYQFSVLPAYILGNVYEQFLGKVIRLTKEHHAIVEDKPEVKKAGGVFYTPKYVVDYIVEQTIGQLIEDKTPKEISELRILDPACGSGSFLIGAYEKLLDFHLNWYRTHHPEKHKDAVFQGVGGLWYLTVDEKKRILLNNLYGVDIDASAVEVTKLNLLLKVLEGEHLDPQKKLRARVLPDLDQNIKCGNSLISPDIYDKQTITDAVEQKRINPFNWESEFPQVKRAGGFDCVIGNPPYGASFSELEASYFHDKYPVFHGVKDVYTCFIAASLTRLKDHGLFSFIVPSAWLGGPDYESLRKLFLSNKIVTIVLLPYDVFKAYIDTAIFVVSKDTIPTTHQVQTYVYDKREKLTNIALSPKDYQVVKQEEWKTTEGAKFVLDSSTIQLLERIRTRCSSKFGDVIDIKRGVLFDKGLLSSNRTSPISHQYFEGDVYRYKINVIANQWIEFDDQMKERPKEFIWFEGPRLLLRRLVNRRQQLMATFTSDTFITNKNLYSVLLKDKTKDLLTVLGILNSKLISYLYLKQVTQATKDDFPQVTIKDILTLPFPAKIDKTQQDSMVAYVEEMLVLQKQHAAARMPEEQNRIQRQIDAIDEQINNLVYLVYGLSVKETEEIEGKGNC